MCLILGFKLQRYWLWEKSKGANPIVQAHFKILLISYWLIISWAKKNHMTNVKKSRSKDVHPTQHEAMATMVTNSIATLELGRAKEPTLPIVHRKLGGHSPGIQSAHRGQGFADWCPLPLCIWLRPLSTSLILPYFGPNQVSFLQDHAFMSSETTHGLFNKNNAPRQITGWLATP